MPFILHCDITITQRGKQRELQPWVSSRVAMSQLKEPRVIKVDTIFDAIFDDSRVKSSSNTITTVIKPKFLKPKNIATL